MESEGEWLGSVGVFVRHHNKDGAPAAGGDEGEGGGDQVMHSDRSSVAELLMR